MESMEKGFGNGMFIEKRSPMDFSSTLNRLLDEVGLWFADHGVRSVGEIVGAAHP